MSESLRARWLPEIEYFVTGAVRSQAPSSLLAFSFEFLAEKREVRLKAHFSGIPTAQDIAELQCVETEIVADMPDSFDVSTEFEIVMPPLEPHLLGDGVVFRRDHTAKTG